MVNAVAGEEVKTRIFSIINCGTGMRELDLNDCTVVVPEKKSYGSKKS